MKPLDHPTKEFVLSILDQANSLTLATIRPDGYPQATAVTFARDGLTLYVSVGLGSQKAQNIQHNNKVSVAVNCDGDYGDWTTIKGLSMGGIATIVHGEREVRHACDCLLKKFPKLRQLSVESHPSLTEGAVFIQIDPEVISVIDYQKGFGHADLVAVPREA